MLRPGVAGDPPHPLLKTFDQGFHDLTVIDLRGREPGERSARARLRP